MRQGIAVTTRACRPKRENVKPQAGIVLGLRREKSVSDNRALSVMPLRLCAVLLIGWRLGMMLEKLNLIAIRVFDKSSGHRLRIKALGLYHGLRPRLYAAFVKALAIVCADVKFPQGIAMIY